MLAKFQAWYARPFSADQNVTGWALFLGMILVISILWKMILSHIVSAASD